MSGRWDSNRHKKQRKCWRFSDGLDLDWAIHADTKLCSKYLLDLQHVQTVVKNILLKCFEYTVYKQSSCKFGYESSGDLYHREIICTIYLPILENLSKQLTNTWESFKATDQYLRIFQSNWPVLENLSKQLTNTWESFKATYQYLRIFQTIGKCSRKL